MASFKNYKTEMTPSIDIAKKKANVRSFAETKEDWRKYCSYWRAYP